MMDCTIVQNRNIETGSSSRRKQSKPSRMARELEENVAGIFSPAVEPEKMEASVSDTEAVATETQPNSDDIGCPYCGIQLSSLSEMKEHVKKKHPPPPLEKLPAEPSMFPTAYHRLASELTHGANMGQTESQQADDNQEKAANDKSLKEKNSSATDEAEDEKIPVGPEGVQKNGARIFHQDAYCDLCDREFCNKYFLKTHRANKHNIFDSPPTFPQPGMGFPEFPANPIDLANAILSKEFLKEKAQQDESLLSKSVNSDLEDFCEICQKHFCNKYYLRKHKADVHGIKADSQPSRSWNVPPLDNHVSAASTGSFTPTSVPGALSAQSGMGAMPNLLYLNPFIPPMALLPAQSLMSTQFAFLPNHTPPLPPPSSLPMLSSMAGVPSSAPSLPSSLASSPALPSSALRSMGVLNADAYCEICRKEFCNKYFLKIHKANKHGLGEDSSKGSSQPSSSPNSPPTSATLNTSQSGTLCASPTPAAVTKTPDDSAKASEANLNNSSEPTANADAQIMPALDMTPLNLKTEESGPLNLSQNASPSDTSQQSFADTNPTSTSPTSAMMSISRPVERLACDICNKEVSSKYVLKIHKFKYHGIGAYSDLELKSEEVKENKPSPETLSMLENGPSDTELTKMGIDPEAYCKICKKEFCSKYFLRTHLFNMHGIRTEATDKRVSSTVHTPKAVPLGPGGGERHTWRWKEPANMTRVFCDICNKELCNKYFLRTHKLNKHGVYTEDEPSPRKAASFTGPPTMVNTNSNQSFKSTSSDELNKSDVSVKPEPKDEGQEKAPPPMSHDSNPMSQYLSQLSEICQICLQRFRNKQWLELHLRNDHGINLEAMPPSPPNENEFRLSLAKQMGVAKNCDFCGLVFHSEKELYSHLMENHQSMYFSNFQMKRRYMKSMKVKMYSCSQCDYKTRWLSNVYSHEQRKHNTRAGQNTSKIFTCKECLRTFSYEHSLIRHMKEYHRVNGVSRDTTITTNGIAQGGVSASPGKRYRCAHCGERFGSRVLCLTHIRIVHKKNLKVKKATNDCNSSPENQLTSSQVDKSKLGVHSCTQCNFSSKFYRNLRVHILLKHKVRRQMKSSVKRPAFSTLQGDQPVTYADPIKVKDGGSFIMQPFTIKEDLDGNFVSATVYLPVKKRITEAKQVSFCLTPALP